MVRMLELPRGPLPPPQGADTHQATDGDRAASYDGMVEHVETETGASLPPEPRHAPQRPTASDRELFPDLDAQLAALGWHSDRDFTLPNGQTMPAPAAFRLISLGARPSVEDMAELRFCDLTAMLKLHGLGRTNVSSKTLMARQLLDWLERNPAESLELPAGLRRLQRTAQGTMRAPQGQPIHPAARRNAAPDVDSDEAPSEVTVDDSDRSVSMRDASPP